MMHVGVTIIIPKGFYANWNLSPTVCLHWLLKLIFAVAKQISTLEIAQQVPEKNLI
jgi:ABC-type phosphate/phosphonate transport system permease subunit